MLGKRRGCPVVSGHCLDAALFRVGGHHLYHVLNLILFFFGLSFFENGNDQGHLVRGKTDAFLLALVISAIITGARDLPDLPWVCLDAVLISSSFTGRYSSLRDG